MRSPTIAPTLKLMSCWMYRSTLLNAPQNRPSAAVMMT